HPLHPTRRIGMVCAPMGRGVKICYGTFSSSSMSTKLDMVPFASSYRAAATVFAIGTARRLQTIALLFFSSIASCMPALARRTSIKRYGM
ncbi:MAG: hypothetical protein ACKPKO_61785, partial [Candidatus Fonsibacter sp.]